MKDKANLVQTVSLNEVLLKSLGEVHQFREGLDKLGVSAVICKHGEYLRHFFCNDPSLIQPLTAGRCIVFFHS